MGLRDWFRGHTADVEATARNFAFVQEWTCRCGAHLKIRAKDSREDGPSNFRPNARGHSQLPSTALTWNGLAEERGWKTSPTICPACQRGMTVAEYKQRVISVETIPGHGT